jgi:hypothetical protein
MGAPHLGHVYSSAHVFVSDQCEGLLDGSGFEAVPELAGLV